MSIFYIYLYYSELDVEHPLYVGKGCGNRLWKHFQMYHLMKEDYFHRKLRSLILKDVRIIVKTPYLNLTEQEAFAMEILLIKQYGRRNNKTGCLYNLTDGGEGPSGCSPSEETRAKISRANKLQPKSHDARARMSKAKLGKKQSESHIKNMTKAIVDRYGQPIESYNPETEETVKQYTHISNVEQDGFVTSPIRRVLKGLYRRAFGLGWRYTMPDRDPIQFDPDSFANQPFGD